MNNPPGIYLLTLRAYLLTPPRERAAERPLGGLVGSVRVRVDTSYHDGRIHGRAAPSPAPPNKILESSPCWSRWGVRNLFY